MTRKTQSIEELELRIMLNNLILKWLRSDDPMLSDPKWSPYVPRTIAHHESMGREMLESCRKKKVERDGDPNTDPVSVGLKPANLISKAGF